MAKIEDILDRLTDGASTVVDIPGNNNDEFRFNSVFIKKDPPMFELLFPPKSWEADSLRVGANCHLKVAHKETSINLVAELDSIEGDRRLRFIAREPVKPESLRDYFRININTPIEARYVPAPKEIQTRAWKMIGTTVDLSGSGLLALFAEKPPSENRIQLCITVPEESEPINCLAHVVRTYRMRKNRYQVAFHFDDITAKARDQIIACCLQEQRRQLRENIQVAAP